MRQAAPIVVTLCIVVAVLQCTERSAVRFEPPEPRGPVEAWMMVGDSRTSYDESLSISFDTVLWDDRCCISSDSCNGLATVRFRVTTSSRDTVNLDMTAWWCPFIDDCGPYGTVRALGYSFTLLELSSICSGGRRLPYSTYNARIRIVPDSLL